MIFIATGLIFHIIPYPPCVHQYPQILLLQHPPTTSIGKQLVDSIITVDGPGRLRLLEDVESLDRYSFHKPKWRYFTTGECVGPPCTDSLVSADCPTSETGVRFNKGQAWFIEVGRISEGEFVWRSYFDRGSDWKDTYGTKGFEEPGNLTTSMKEIFDNFSGCNEARDIDSENDQEILKNLGKYVEARLKLSRHDGYSSHKYETAKTVHVTPEDYDLLKKGSKSVEPPVWAKSYLDGAEYSRKNPSVGLKDDAVSPAPSYFFQVDAPVQRTSYGEPQKAQPENFHIVVETDESLAGKITAKTFLVMPSKASNVRAVPDWVEEMLSGEGDLGERWNEAIYRGIQGFERFHSQVSSGRVFPDEQSLLTHHHFFDSRSHKTRALQYFLTSVLQNEVEEIMSTAPSGKSSGKGKQAGITPRVSGMASVSNYHLKDIEEIGLFHSHDLSGPPSCVQTVLRVIHECQKRKDQEDAAEERRKELEQIQHQRRIELERQKLERLRGLSPSYEGSSGISSVPMEGRESEGFESAKRSGGKSGTKAEGTATLAISGEPDRLEVQVRPRHRSRSPWRSLLCSSRSDRDDD